MGRAAALLGAVVLGACARSDVVEAPMMSGAEVASALALVRPQGKDSDRSGLRSDLPFAVGDRWSGSYDCANGRTTFEMTFEQVHPGEGPDEVEVDVLVELRSPVGPGSVAMHGSYRPGARRLQLEIQEWLEPLPGSRLVDFAGTVQASGTYTGRVAAPGAGCTSLTAAPARPKVSGPDGGRGGLMSPL